MFLPNTFRFFSETVFAVYGIILQPDFHSVWVPGNSSHFCHFCCKNHCHLEEIHSHCHLSAAKALVASFPTVGPPFFTKLNIADFSAKCNEHNGSKMISGKHADKNVYNFLGKTDLKEKLQASTFFKF